MTTDVRSVVSHYRSAMQPSEGVGRAPVTSTDLDRAGVTAREREVLACVVMRLTNREIADRLGCSVRTVESHVSSLLGKLEVPDRTTLAKLGSSLMTGRVPGRSRAPRPMTSFVGRGGDLDAIQAALQEEWMVTLVGAPGVGKTRLAVEFAKRVADAGPETAWDVVFCDLTRLEDDAHVADVVLAALDANPAPDRTALEALRELTLEHPVLLILDNCEHVVHGAAAAVGALLAGDAGIRVLATSREPLGVDAEVTYPVHVLGLASSEGTAGERPAQADAVRLFVDRARAARPDFRLEPDDAEAVAEICRRLDGLPLAIELAAPRLRAFTVRQLEAALDDVLGALSPDLRTDDARSRALRASIEWSHRSLAPAERRLFRRLSVFAGPAGLDAIEAVCSDASLTRREVFGLLGSLVDRSLVEVEARPSDGNRFRLLFPIRSFAAEQAADADEIDALEERHAAFYAEKAEEAETNLLGPEAQAWVRRIHGDVDDIRSALRWSYRSGVIEPGLRIVAALSPYWADHDRRREWIDHVIELVTAKQTSTPVVRIRALIAAADLLDAWDPRIAIGFAEEARTLAEATGDARTIASADLSLGHVLGRLPERSEESRRRLLSAFAWFTDAGDRRAAGLALVGLGLSEPALEAARTWRRAGGLFAAVGDDLQVANMLYLSGLGLVREHVDLDEAEAMLLDAIELAPRHGSAYEAAHARSAMGHLRVVRGDDQAARPLLEEVLSSFRAAGDVRCTARCESLLGVIATRTGPSEAALPAFRAAIADAERVVDLPTLAESLDGIGSLLSPARDETALALHGAAATSRQTGRLRANVSGVDHSASIQVRRDRLGGAADDAWARGASLAPMDAARLALMETR